REKFEKADKEKSARDVDFDKKDGGDKSKSDSREQRRADDGRPDPHDALVDPDAKKKAESGGGSGFKDKASKAKDRKSSAKGGGEPDKDKDDKGEKQKPKAPQVWKRDEARKTFARVYVGDGNSLELVSIHVSVVVEGPRARTIVDHVFRNPH